MMMIGSKADLWMECPLFCSCFSSFCSLWATKQRDREVILRNLIVYITFSGQLMNPLNSMM